MTKNQLERIASILNQFSRCDSRAVRAVFEFRHSINADLKTTDIIARDEGAGVETISALSLLNSCLEGTVRLAIDVDETNPEPFKVVRAHP